MTTGSCCGITRTVFTTILTAYKKVEVKKMKIGLTYDLRSEYLADGLDEETTAEFDREDTIEALEKALSGLGHVTDRIGRAQSLICRLATGDRWDFVFNIAEGLNGIGREAQVPAILDVYRIPYTFSDPLVMALTLHKGMTKQVLQSAGVPTGYFHVVSCAEDLGRIDFAPPYFIKPVAEGTGKGITPDSIIADPMALEAACMTMAAAYCQPVIVESLLPGREFTIGILGTGSQARSIGTLEVHLLPTAQPNVYSYLNKEQCETRVSYQLVRAADDPVVREAEAIAIEAWHILGCRDAGRVDLRCDRAGRPQFMEVNPLAGLHPQHSDLPILCNMAKIPYERLIEEILSSARERIQSADIAREAVYHAHRYCA